MAQLPLLLRFLELLLVQEALVFLIPLCIQILLLTDLGDCCVLVLEQLAKFTFGFLDGFLFNWLCCFCFGSSTKWTFGCFFLLVLQWTQLQISKLLEIGAVLGDENERLGERFLELLVIRLGLTLLRSGSLDGHGSRGCTGLLREWWLVASVLGVITGDLWLLERLLGDAVGVYLLADVQLRFGVGFRALCFCGVDEVDALGHELVVLLQLFEVLGLLLGHGELGTGVDDVAALCR